MAIAVLLNCTLMMGQSELDALKYVQTDINGTARYMGMAGAFGALGGDASAIKDNPAGLGVYRTSEISGTMNVLMQNSTGSWNGVSTSTDNPFKTGFNNFSFVLANPTLKSENGGSGLLSSNWSFGFNRLKNLNRTVNIKGGPSASSITDFMASFTNGLSESDLNGTNDPNGNSYNITYVPWISILAYDGYLINPVTGTNNWVSLLNKGVSATPSFNMTETGHIDEYSVGWSGNFSNLLFLGTTLNYQRINYSLTSAYNEIFNSGGNMSLNNNITSTGSGFNLNIGGIVRPNDFLRFGLALHTPTVYSMEDHYYATLGYNTVKSSTTATPTNWYNNFQIQGPLQINLSGAFIVGKMGLISAEYDYSNYANILLMDQNGSTQAYTTENQRMSTNLNNGQTLKIGGEYKLNENISLRAGFAKTGSTTKSDATKQMYESTTRTDTEYYLNNGITYLTAGIGYREASWFIDCAFVHKNLDETYVPYLGSVTQASLITKTNNVLLTLGFKF